MTSDTISNGLGRDSQGSYEPVLSPEAFRMPRKLVPSAWFEHGPFMLWLVKAARPALAIELGVANGFSYFTLCQAVAENGLATKCFGIDTWRGDAHTGKYGDEVYAGAFVHNKQSYPDFSSLLRSTFDDALKDFADGTVDLLHIDGFHTYDAVSNDFAKWRPKMSAQGVVLMHDTNVRGRDFGVWRLWEELKGSYPSFEFHHGFGLGVLAVGDRIPAGLRPLFDASETSRTEIRQVYARLGTAVRLQYENEYLQTLLAQINTEGTSRLQAASSPVAHRLRGTARRRALASVAAACRSRATAAHKKLGRAMRSLVRAAGRRSKDRLKTAWVAATRPGAPKVVRYTARRLRDLALSVSSPRLAARYCSAPQSGSLLSRPTAAALRHIIVRSGHFDRAWYLAANPDVSRAGVDPVLHYLRSGAQENRDPSPRFSTRAYRTTNGLLASPMNPLVHYCLAERRHRRGSHATTS